MTCHNPPCPAFHISPLPGGSSPPLWLSSTSLETKLSHISSCMLEVASVRHKLRKMAEAFEKDQDPFRCSACLDPLRNPVTIPCGHSYCMSCIRGCWDQEDQKGDYSCPQCRERFSPRPALRKSTMLAELMDKMKTTGIQAARPAPCYAGPGDVECDLCSERKLKAVKSCLVCLISLCQTHVEPHYNIPALKKHKLVPASTDLQQKICSQHNKLIEVFCCTDQKCICMLCTMDEHKGHDTVSAAAERKEREVRSQLHESERIIKGAVCRI